MLTKVIPYEVYCDGACKSIGNTTFGGWSFIVVKNNIITYEAFGGEVDSTNQRMELTGAIRAIEYLESIKEYRDQVKIYSDSAYLINCCNQNWYRSWQYNGWKNSKGQPVANIDLWEKLIPYFNRLDYFFGKVAGHSGVVYNERCDKLAQDYANILKRNWRGYE